MVLLFSGTLTCKNLQVPPTTSYKNDVHVVLNNNKYTSTGTNQYIDRLLKTISNIFATVRPIHVLIRLCILLIRIYLSRLLQAICWFVEYRYHRQRLLYKDALTPSRWQQDSLWAIFLFICLKGFICFSKILWINGNPPMDRCPFYLLFCADLIWLIS